jgi:hypothetical protein
LHLYLHRKLFVFVVSLACLACCCFLAGTQDGCAAEEDAVSVEASRKRTANGPLYCRIKNTVKMGVMRSV